MVPVREWLTSGVIINSDHGNSSIGVDSCGEWSEQPSGHSCSTGESVSARVGPAATQCVTHGGSATRPPDHWNAPRFGPGPAAATADVATPRADFARASVWCPPGSTVEPIFDSGTEPGPERQERPSGRAKPWAEIDTIARPGSSDEPEPHADCGATTDHYAEPGR
jgi:hypothetical protein